MADTDVALEERDKSVRAETYRAQSRIVRMIDECLLVVQNGTALCSGHGHDRGINFTCGLLAVRAFNSLWRARQDLVDGYPVQALSLVRGAFEDWVALLWFEQDPSRLPLVLSHVLEEVEHPSDAHGRPVRLPLPSAMLTDLGATTSVGGSGHYALLSKFAHVCGTSLRWQFSFDGVDLNVRSGGYYDERDFRITAFFLIDVAISLFQPLSRLQERWLGTADGEWLRRAATTVERGFAVTEEILDEVEARLRSVEETDGQATSPDSC